MGNESAIDTTNKFLIGKRGDDFVFLRPLPQVLTEDDALLVAAYIVALCSDTERWKDVLQAVCNT
jgi:hypothetical protein